MALLTQTQSGEPRVRLEDVVFAEADAHQRKLAWELNGASWATPMDIGDYVERETHLSEQDLTRDGGCTYWVLHLRQDRGQIVAGCEMTRKTVLVSGRGRARPERAPAYAIASVYTNPRYRRLGMAAFLLRRVQEYMDGPAASPDGPAACSALYSDIGRVYYAGLGWAGYASEQATLSLIAATADGGAGSAGPAAPEPRGTRFLALADLPPYCARDEAALTERMAAYGADDARTHVAFVPSYPQLAWQLAREQFMAGVLFGREVERRGAVTDAGGSWIYWDHDWREKKLKVLRVVVPAGAADEQKIADVYALLRAAVHEARAWDLRKVLIWNPDETVTMGAKELSNHHEDEVMVLFDERIDGSIPSLRWREGADVGEISWEANEYYAWC